MSTRRNLLVVISDANDLHAGSLNENYREIKAAVVICCSITEIRLDLDMGQ
jgi:hypothetical protein